ncbi:MAG TPA: RseA family anti-sigma factor [Gammaproteobacteria bacterium]|nr:RseA family anti-sigma factor [Gammaproteobacteria bacterium]
MQHAEEQFSALVDDESELPPAPLVDVLLEDDAARRRWSRHHLIGEVLRDREAIIDLGLADRIRAAIDAEPALLAPTALPPRAAPPAGRARRPWAVAAALAAIGFTGLMLALRAPAPPPAELPLAAARAPEAASTPGLASAAVAAPGASAEPQFVRWDDTGIPSTADPRSVEFHRRLNSYLVNFNEQRSNLGVPGVHPYVRIVGFEGEDEP